MYSSMRFAATVWYVIFKDCTRILLLHYRAKAEAFAGVVLDCNRDNILRSAVIDPILENLALIQTLSHKLQYQATT